MRLITRLNRTRPSSPEPGKVFRLSWSSRLDAYLHHFNFSYSAFASTRMGIVRSASFQIAKKYGDVLDVQCILDLGHGSLEQLRDSRNLAHLQPKFRQDLLRIVRLTEELAIDDGHHLLIQERQPGYSSAVAAIVTTMSARSPILSIAANRLPVNRKLSSPNTTIA